MARNPPLELLLSDEITPILCFQSSDANYLSPFEVTDIFDYPLFSVHKMSEINTGQVYKEQSAAQPTNQTPLAIFPVIGWGVPLSRAYESLYE